MKLVIFLGLIFSLKAFAVEPLDLVPGYWKTTTNMNSNPLMKQIEAQMKSLPAEQRKMVMAQMKEKMGKSQVTYQCISKDDIANWESKMKKQMKKDEMKDCKYVVNKSTSKELNTSFVCKDPNKNMVMKIKLDSPKMATVGIKISATSEPIESKMVWMSKACKKDAKVKK